MNFRNSIFGKHNLVNLKGVLEGTVPENEVVSVLGEEKVVGVEEIREELVQASPCLRLFGQARFHARRKVVKAHHVPSIFRILLDQSH